MKIENWRLASLRDILNCPEWNLDILVPALNDLSRREVEIRVFIGEEKSPIIHKYPMSISTIPCEKQEFIFSRGIVQFWIPKDEI